MAYTDINSEDRLVQKTFAEHLQTMLACESIYAWKHGSVQNTSALTPSLSHWSHWERE